MNLRALSMLGVLSLCTMVPIVARAQPATQIAQDLYKVTNAKFDHAADVLAKDPAGAKPLFASVAAAYETILSRPLSRSAQARVLANAGAAHYLAGDPGLAMLDLRRAQLLSPATPNLRERLAAARAAVRNDSPSAAPTSFPVRDADTPDLAGDLALSAPRQWLWRTAALGYACFWGALLLRLLIPRRSARQPGPAILIALGALFLIPAGGLAALHFRDADAMAQAVVLHESIGRSEPDDLTGSPSSPTPLKPGFELRILERRAGGDGRPWIRVAPIDGTPVADESPVWIPESAAARVLDAHG